MQIVDLKSPLDSTPEQEGQNETQVPRGCETAWLRSISRSAASINLDDQSGKGKWEERFPDSRFWKRGFDCYRRPMIMSRQISGHWAKSRE
jgi:hypothetical protein